jgi:hypothetical protein
LRCGVRWPSTAFARQTTAGSLRRPLERNPHPFRDQSPAIACAAVGRPQPGPASRWHRLRRRVVACVVECGGPPPLSLAKPSSGQNALRPKGTLVPSTLPGHCVCRGRQTALVPSFAWRWRLHRLQVNQTAKNPQN